MSLTAEAISKIESLVKPEVVEVNGRKYSTVSLNMVSSPVVYAISINTLTGLADYIENCIDIDSIEIEKCMIHICDQESVRLVGPVFGDFRQRETIVKVNALTENNFSFGSYYDLERFIVALQANFVRTEVVEQILQFVSSVSSEAKVKQSDDGVSQQTEIKTGVHLVAEATVPNPVTLQPYRTFLDIIQPSSQYVFRIKNENGVKCALYEAGGGQWKLEAIKRIREWFELQKDNGRIPEGMTIIS